MADKITSRSEDYSQWYIDLVRSAKLADYADVKGCMVIRPNGYAIWEKMQAALDRMFKETGHVNAYFPLFIPDEKLRDMVEELKPMPPDIFAQKVLNAIAKNKAIIIVPSRYKLIWWFNRLSPLLGMAVAQKIFRKMQKEFDLL